MTEQPGQPLVVVYDPITTIRWDYDYEIATLGARGINFELLDDPTTRPARLAEADVVIVSQRLPDEMLERAARACGVMCYSVGMDGVNASLAARMNVTVSNVPGYCTEEVSDHGIALLMALQRQIVPFAWEAANGNWDIRGRDSFYEIRRIAGTVVGVVGLGRIGARLAAKARGLGMTTLAHDPFACAEDHPHVELLPLDDVLRRSDAVVLCAALSDSTRGLIGSEQLALMRPDAVLVNVARGGLVDEAALAAALTTGRLRGAALDVRSPEPPDPTGDPLRGLDNVVLTQHVGATSIESTRDMHVMATERIIEMLESAGRLVTVGAER